MADIQPFAHGRNHPAGDGVKLSSILMSNRRNSAPSEIGPESGVSPSDELADSHNLGQKLQKSKTILIVDFQSSRKFISHWICLTKMIKSNPSYQKLIIGDSQQACNGRLPLGTALLAIFGVSLLGWAVILAPAVALLHD